MEQIVGIETKNKKTLVIAIIIAVFLIASGFFVYKKYFQKVSAPAPEQVSVPEETQTLGGQIYEQIQNPIGQIIETNPFEAKTNPFEETKTNPFEGVYKNPFE